MESTYQNAHISRDELDDYRIMPAWCAFVLGGVTTFLLVYLGIARPAAHELDMMRRQMGALEQTVWEVAGMRDDVAEVNSLLSELNDQRAQISKARLAVKDVATLRRQLQSEAAHVQDALATVAELGAIKDSLLSFAGEAAEAAEVASVSEGMCKRLAKSATSTYEALQASDDLLAMKDDLLTMPGATELALDALDQLLDMRDELHAAGDEIDTADAALQSLVALKSMVLAQQPEMATTLETLELISDLSAEFDQAALSFDRIRHWMVEVVATESILERARRTLAPLTEIANVRHLQPETVRQFVSQLNQIELLSPSPVKDELTIETASIKESDLVIE